MAQGVACHECRHSASIQRGDYADIPFDETPCAKCVSGKHRAVESLEQGHGRILSYNDGLGGWMRTVAGGGYGAARETDEGMADAMELLRAFCVGLAGASELQRQILVLRMEGLSMVEVARRLGRSRQSIGQTWNRLARRCFARYDKRRERTA